MIRYCVMRIVQAVETVRLNSLEKLMKEIVYFDRVAVPVEIDLAQLRPLSDFQQRSDEKLIEIKPDMIGNQVLRYPIKSRALKAENYLRNGYRGFAVVSGDAVSGDIWCSTSRSPRNGLLHEDEGWLKIRSVPGGVYSFDMYVNPQKRGLNLAAALQNGTLHRLRQEGFSKAYGFFWADNIAALWVHRTLHWKELERVKATRFIFSRKFSKCCSQPSS